MFREEEEEEDEERDDLERGGALEEYSYSTHCVCVCGGSVPSRI